MIKAINYLTVCAILIALFGLSAIARADTHTVMGNTMHLEVSDIDPTRTGTLTLIKRVGEQPRPVPGALFSIKRIQNVDLSTEHGWAAARTMSITQTATEPTDYIDTATTDAAGEAQFLELPVGLYLVTEEDRGASPWNVQPFLLTIPTGSVDGKSWEYDVRVSVKTNPHTSNTPENTPTTSPTVPPSGGPSDGAIGDSEAARRQNLAYTGVQIVGALAVGTGLILGGAILRRRAK